MTALRNVQALRTLKSGWPRAGARYYRQPSSRIGPLAVSEEVIEAVKTNKPVVALETTIYTHGFPYPDNVTLSSSLEALVREHGAVPATIGILNGVAKVGMHSEDIVELLERAGDPYTIKVSRRDLGFICARENYSGGTTIAGTLVLAHLAGIKIFATGGLGGVHRDRLGETSMDVSADLTELGRTPMALVSSGCKSFLDLPRTLEFLETQGVGVGTFADGREGPVKFPAFWTRESDLKSPNTIKDEKEAAAILHAQLQLNLESGLLFANPIPLEHSLPKEMMDSITGQAVEEAANKGILGSANTPYILSRIRELTEGGTVHANRKLIEANVVRGAKLAVELAKLEAETGVSTEHQYTFTSIDKRPVAEEVDVLVAGSIAIDLNCNYLPRSVDDCTVPTPALQTSNPAAIEQSLGGVGQNVATACHYMGARTVLCSIVGDDAAGKSAKIMLSDKKLRTDGVMLASQGARTAQYVAVNDLKKDLVLAMADMKIFETRIEDFKTTWMPFVIQHKPKWVILDANWSPENLRQWITGVKEAGIKIAFEPVSVAKSIGIVDALEGIWKANVRTKEPYPDTLIDIATPNQLEAQAMSIAIPKDEPWAAYIDHMTDRSLDDTLKEHLKDQCSISMHTIIASLRLLSLTPCILTKLGANGLLQIELLRSSDPRLSDTRAQKYIMRFDPTDYSAAGPITPRWLKSSKGVSSFSVAVYLRHHPAQVVKDPNSIVSVNGVGDTLLGALIALLSFQPGTLIEDAIDVAQAAAFETLMSSESVSPTIERMARA